MAEELQLKWQKKGMERLKWFDFLGALLLLFSVTRAAITPQVVSGDSYFSGQEVDLIRDSGEHSPEIDLSRPVANVYLEKDSKRLSAQEGWDTEDLPVLPQELDSSFELDSEGSGGDLNYLFDSAFVQTRSSPSAPAFIR